VRGEAETQDGRPYNNSYCHVFKMREGKIREVTEYFDTELTTKILVSVARRREETNCPTHTRA
jgi:hypothetical protein